MQTIVFNTTLRTVKLYAGEAQTSTILEHFDNVPTVKPKEEGFYEVFQKNNELDPQVPVARFPIANTNMLIVK
jgi:hypothetical protein